MTPFDKFSNLYSLSKTLRFELKPVPRTKALLNLGKDPKVVFAGDKVRAENYAIIKKYIDELHTKFINAALALQDAYIDVTGFQVADEKQKEASDEQGSENTEEGEKEVTKSPNHKKIINLFNQLSISETIKEYNDWVKIDSKNNVSGKFFGKELIDILRKEFKDELDTEVDAPVLFFNRDEKGKKRKLRDVFNSFGKDEGGEGKDFTTYFTTAFHDNRKNYYKGDGKAGRVATRIVDENLKRFLTNREKLENIRKSASGNSEEIKKIKDEKKRLALCKKYEALVKSFNDQSSWKDFESKKAKKEDLSPDFEHNDWQGYAFGDKYDHFLQKKINSYNFIVGKLNKGINESEIDTERFLKLHKQVHGEIKKLEEEFYVDEKNVFGTDYPFIKKFIKHSHTKLVSSQRIFDRFLKEQYSKPEQVFISKRAINTISMRCFAAWHTFGGAILEQINKIEKKERKKLPDFVDLQTIKRVLDSVSDAPVDELFKYKYLEKIDPYDVDRQDQQERLKKLQAELKEGEHWENFLKVIRYEFDSLKEKHEKAAAKLLAETVYKKDGKQQIALLFDFAESSNGIFNMTKYFALRRKGVMVEDRRYANRDYIHELVENYLDGSDDDAEERCLINQYYKALKHFVTQKPWIEDKIVLNFSNAQFLGGWPVSQEKEKGAVILRKQTNGEWMYYLAVLEEKDKFFDDENLYKDAERSSWQKMNYTQLQRAHQMLPKMFITPFLTKKDVKTGNESEDWVGIDREQNGAKEKQRMGIRPSDKILKGYIDKKHTKDNLDPEFLQEYLEYLKGAIKTYYKKEFDLDISEFENTSPFNKWAEENVYDIDFVGISEEEIAKLLTDKEDKGKVYLFQIYNKDFEIDEEIGKEKYGDKFVSKKEWRQQKERREEEKEQGIENEHTMFLKLLFDEERNLKNERGIVYKLSGGAKMFYRPASKDLKKIRDRYGKEISERQRYGENKLMFYVPIVMNFVNKNEGWRINSDINKLIYDTPFGQDRFRIIALDRGEKNLAYLTVLNEEGKILQIESLNRITRFDKNGKPIKEKNQGYDKDGNPIGDAKLEEFKDYHNLLDKRQVERLKARKSWEPIEKIENLKEGYLGFVVNKLANLVINIIQEDKIPILVLENLNVGMKQGRIQIEKQVYSKVEEKIAKKLSYLVDKKLGNFFNAWQLTPEIKTFGGDIDGKDQVGIIFYVNPSYTSATCPRCGFRKRKYIKADNIYEEFKNGNVKISFDGVKYTFEFSSQVKDKNGESSTVPDKVYSNVRRVIWNKRANNGRGDSEEIADVTEELDKLFGDFGVNANSSTLSEQIQQKEFWARLAKWFNCILDIRNSINKRRAVKNDTDNVEIEEWGGENRDFIFCPRCRFDSEDIEKRGKLIEEIYIGDSPESVEFNGDANGAYNTGRKGIISVEIVKEHQRALIDFKKRWQISAWPKKENAKVPFDKEGKELALTLVKLKESAKKDVFYYCILGKSEKLSKGEKDIELIPREKRVRKYPDLFISDADWDKFVQGAK